MKDKGTPEKLKKLESVLSIMIEELTRLTIEEDFELPELIKIRNRVSNTINQLDFWMERGNSQRFYEELKSQVEWVIKNYGQMIVKKYKP